MKKRLTITKQIPKQEPKPEEQEKCIIEWDLYHEMMEKKNGVRKIDTEYKYLRKK